MAPLWLELSFLTRLPVPEAPFGPGAMGRAVRAFPVAGAAVGAVSVLGLLVGSVAVDPVVGAVLAVAAAELVTGGLHLDGFSDCLDGLATNGDAGRRLEAMHDPRAGALGSAGTALWLVLKIALVHATLVAGTAAPALWCAAIVARAGLPVEVHLGAAATPGRGLFASLKAEVARRDVGVALGLAGALLVPAVIVDPGIAPALAAGIAVACAASLGWALLWRARVGGLNGDVLGAAVELREALLLAAFASPLLA